MIERTPFCDGCGAKMTWEEYQDSSKVSLEAAQALLTDPETKLIQNQSGVFIPIQIFDQNFAVPVFTEIFCPACCVNAQRYWGEKIDMVRDASDETDRRFVRHRRSFFETLKAKVRKVRHPAVPVMEEPSENLRASQPS